LSLIAYKAQVVHWGTYEAVSDGAFAEMVDFVIDYAMRVSEVHFPKGVAQ
jgi:hypothetical protein